MIKNYNIINKCIDFIIDNCVVNTIEYWSYCFKTKYYIIRNLIFANTFLGEFDRNRLTKKADKKRDLLIKQKKLTGDE